MYRDDGQNGFPDAHEQQGTAVVVDKRREAVAQVGSVGVVSFEAAEPGNIREQEVYRLTRDSETYEVTIESDVTLEDHKAATSPEDWALFEASVEPLVGKKVVRIGATFEGGGVAMIVPPAHNLWKKAGVEAYWGVLEEGDSGAFHSTKKMHNLQQDVAGPEVEFTEEDKEKHQRLGRENFAHMNEQEYFRDADVYFIDDPQPAAMIPLIREHYPGATIVYRNHIQTDRDLMAAEGSQQQKIYEYLRDDCEVGLVDAYIAHPVEQFVPYGTPNVAFLPPTSDPFEDLNMPLTDEQMAELLDSIDEQIAIQNRERRLKNGSDIDDQPPLDRDRDWITLFARFDPAKGKDIGMELQALVIEEILTRGGTEDQIPIYIDAGNGSIDDTDRERMIDAMMELRRTEHEGIKDYIRVVGFDHNYPRVNALLRSSKFTTNPSTKEGFEHRATESIIKGVPAIVSNRGGLPLQVEDGVSGFVMDFDDMEAELRRVAGEVADGILHPEKYEALQETTRTRAAEFNVREIGTVANVTRLSLTLQGKGDRTWLLDDLARREALAAAA